MSYSADLRIVDDLAETADAPAAIERASIALNHGLLVGELLGVAIGEAQRALDAVSAREDPILTTSEVQTLCDTYRAVRTALDLAISPEGVPLDNPAGERLRGSRLLEADAAGTLAVRHRRLPLPELRVRLAAIDELLGHALAHHCGVRLEQT
jgi:hypothetical protein